jgi:hypothetical protein
MMLSDDRRGEHHAGQPLAGAAEAGQVRLDRAGAEVRLDAAAGRVAGFRVVDDHQVGALGADQHAADRGVEPAGGDDGPAAQRQLAGPQARIPVVRHADGRQDDVILRPLQERPLAVGRLRGSPLGGPVQSQDRVADFGVVVGQGLVTFQLVLDVGQDLLRVGAGGGGDQREREDAVHHAVDRHALDDRGLAFAAGGGNRLVAAVLGRVQDGGDHFPALVGPVAPEHVGEVAGQERVDVGRVGQAALDVGRIADLDILERRPDLAFAQGVGHPDAGFLVVAGQGGDLLDLPLQVGDRLLAFLDFGLKGHGIWSVVSGQGQACGAAGIRSGCVGAGLGVLNPVFRLDSWKPTFCSWKPAVCPGLPAGLARFAAFRQKKPHPQRGAATKKGSHRASR